VFELGTLPQCSFTPPADADKSYRVVRSGDLWQPVREIPRHLPAERDAFVGRGADLQAIARHFDDGARLLTLLGQGGTGKTRLAVRYGMPGSATGRAACGSAISPRPRPQTASTSPPAARWASARRRRRRGAARGGDRRPRPLPVVLDNFEQVAQHAAATIGRWLDGAPEAAFMVTSRERLNLAGEVGAAGRAAAAGRAGDRALRRARAAQRPGFVLDDAQRAAVAEVTSLLDGLPLAIELAAARIAVLSPAQLLLRLRDRFALLAGAAAAAARRRCARRSTGRGSCSAAGSSRHSSNARCSKAASRSPPPKR
jgi:predicted ATPase